MKKSFSVMFLIFLSLNNYSQNLKIGFQSGLGNFKMSGLKNFNNFLKVNNPIDAKVVSNYPSYYYYQPEITFAYKQVNFGLLYSYQSTGSRISVRDYSGEYRFDTKIRSNSPGIICEFIVNPKNRFKFVLNSEFGILYTKLNLKEYLRAYGEVMIDNKDNYDSKNYYLKPGLKILYPVNFISVEFNINYLKQYGKEILENNNNKKLQYNSKELKPDWSGFRFGISAYIVFPFKKKTSNENKSNTLSTPPSTP